MRRCATSLVTRAMPIKTTETPLHTHGDACNNGNGKPVLERRGGSWNSHALPVGTEGSTVLWRTTREVLKKANTDHRAWQSHAWVTPERTESMSTKKPPPHTHTHMSTAALLLRAHVHQQTKCSVCIQWDIIQPLKQLITDTCNNVRAQE